MGANQSGPGGYGPAAGGAVQRHRQAMMNGIPSEYARLRDPLPAAHVLHGGRVEIRRRENAMPYEKTSDLPESVRDNLPEGANEIYLAAFNSAWEQYADQDDREATAHRVAWSAVKQSYEKRDGEWARKR